MFDRYSFIGAMPMRALRAALAASMFTWGCGGGGSPSPATSPPPPPPPPQPAGPGTPTINETGGVPAGYRVVWSDEFDVDGLPDATKWNYDTDRNFLGWYNNEL